jgi:hypothetical protein
MLTVTYAWCQFNPFILNVVMLSVIMVSVVAPNLEHELFFKHTPNIISTLVTLPLPSQPPPFLPKSFSLALKKKIVSVLFNSLYSSLLVHQNKLECFSLRLVETLKVKDLPGACTIKLFTAVIVAIS